MGRYDESGKEADSRSGVLEKALTVLRPIGSGFIFSLVRVRDALGRNATFPLRFFLFHSLIHTLPDPVASISYERSATLHSVDAV